MSEYHALASPSSAHRWLNCANALAMEIGQPEGDTKAADLGTDKHELLTLCMQFDKNAMDYDGHVLGKGHTVNAQFAGDVQTVLDNVRARISSYRMQGAVVTVELEQDLPIGHITGEEGATGRGDICLIIEWPGYVDGEVIDAKFGYQEVDAKDNPQLLLYPAGMMEKFGLVHEFANFSMVIEQPLRSGSEWELPAKAIDDWCRDVVQPAAEKSLTIHKLALEGQRALREEDFAPGEKTCMWCKAFAVCPAARAKAEEVMTIGFETLDSVTLAGSEKEMAEAMPIERLAEIFPSLEFIEDWAKAVRARIELEVFAGRQIPGVKVVAGKKGNRAWASDEEAEAMMKKFKMKQDQMYSFKLLGPKPILDALKDQPRRLKQIESLVVQPAGKPHVVLDSDPRPAIVIEPVENGFDAEDELC
jgi:hypothetical protein